MGRISVLRTMHAASFEMIDEMLNHYRQTLRHGEQIVCRFLIEVFLVERHIKLRANFSARSFGDIEVLRELLIATALETFGDV